MDEGAWVKVMNIGGTQQDWDELYGPIVKCSVCGEQDIDPLHDGKGRRKYCSYCGARMRETIEALVIGGGK